MVARLSRRARLATRSVDCAGAEANSCSRCDDAVHLSILKCGWIYEGSGIRLGFGYVELCFGLARSPLPRLSRSLCLVSAFADKLNQSGVTGSGFILEPSRGETSGPEESRAALGVVVAQAHPTPGTLHPMRTLSLSLSLSLALLLSTLTLFERSSLV